MELSQVQETVKCASFEEVSDKQFSWLHYDYEQRDCFRQLSCPQVAGSFQMSSHGSGRIQEQEAC